MKIKKENDELKDQIRKIERELKNVGKSQETKPLEKQTKVINQPPSKMCSDKDDTKKCDKVELEDSFDFDELEEEMTELETKLRIAVKNAKEWEEKCNKITNKTNQVKHKLAESEHKLCMLNKTYKKAKKEKENKRSKPESNTKSTQTLEAKKTNSRNL